MTQPHGPASVATRAYARLADRLMTAARLAMMRDRRMLADELVEAARAIATGPDTARAVWVRRLGAGQ